MSGFTRNELIKLYSQFKALCEVTAEKKTGSRYDVSLGVDYETFKESVPEVAFETENFVKRVFEIANENPSQNYINWDNFLLAHKAIKDKNLHTKIDLFFKIIDSDGNGKLSYEEIYEICYGNFEKLTTEKDDLFMHELAEYFTDVIFRVSS